MSKSIQLSTLALLALTYSAHSHADVGVGLKAGTLGIGAEVRWSPLAWFDLRLGANQYDYEEGGSLAGINYDATFAMDTYYLTGNFRFPLSPFRVTAGAFSNGNELQAVSQDTGGLSIDIGGTLFDPADYGSLQSVTSFDSVSPYLGAGYDFEIFGKVGLNFDFGVLWQGEPTVTLTATGLGPGSPPELGPALIVEQQQLADDVSDYKAWPVVSLGLVYNF